MELAVIVIVLAIVAATVALAWNRRTFRCFYCGQAIKLSERSCTTCGVHYPR